MPIRGQVLALTGTRRGLTDRQYAAAVESLTLLFPDRPPASVLHGGCVGADEQLALACRCLWGDAVRVVAYPALDVPPELVSRRARADADEVRPPAPAPERDAEMVRLCDRILACPDGPERSKSGTWSAVRCARDWSRPCVLIQPSGQRSRRGPLR